MDPDANLTEQQELARCIIEAEGDPGQYRQDTGRELPDDALRLAELQQALDEWICKGGFLPAAWRRS